MIDNKLVSLAQKERIIEKKKLTKKGLNRRIANWHLFFLNNLDIFVTKFLEIKLHPFQEQLLSDFSYYDNMTIIASRGLSKSFTIAVFSIAIALLCPNIKVMIVSLTLNQSNVIIKEKIDEMLTSQTSILHSPVLKYLRSVGYITITKDGNSEGLVVNFGNGSKIFAVNCGESVRGKRSNVKIIDEAVLLKKSEYDAIIEPTSEPYVFKNIIFEPKEYFLTSAKTRDNWIWGRVKDSVNEHYKKRDSRTGFFAGDIFTAVASGILTKRQYENRKRTTDEFAFQTESLNIWLGESKDAIFKYKDFHESQISESVFVPSNSINYNILDERIKKKSNEIRVLATDIAIVGGKKNDNTVVMLGTINLDTNEKRVDYIRSENGMNSISQVMMMKRLFYDYDCDYFVIDTKGVGNVIYDLLTVETEETEVVLHDFAKFPNGRYPAWGINQDEQLRVSSHEVVKEKLKRIISVNTEDVIIPVAGNAELNSLMHYSVWATLRDKKLVLLKDKSEIEKIIEERDPTFYIKDAEEKAEVLAPYYETNYMISETIALDMTIGLGNKISVREKSTATKDRYMTLAMFSYFSDKVLNKHLLSQYSDDEIDMSDFEGAYGDIY